MKGILKLCASVAAGMAIMMSAPSAMAGGVNWSVNIGAPVFAAPAPVYVAPAPVYVQPQAVYVQPAPAVPVVTQYQTYYPQPYYVEGGRYERFHHGYYHHYYRHY
jgi:hypothetical protein